ncbi:hypothetical protein [Streptomyces bobili]|uniref:hypothetical protein n=1 Tax=Streptomyces bobili TaxID=67280 RepID=UPI00380C6621
MDELTTLLDRPTAMVLEGVEEALAALDLTGPLARALRSGLPEELCWPALEEVLEGFDAHDALRVTCTWPVLTVYGDDRAVAVDHAGARASCVFRVPVDAVSHAVHFAGGQFLVSWTTDGRARSNTLAFWNDRPDEVFALNTPSGCGLTEASSTEPSASSSRPLTGAAASRGSGCCAPAAGRASASVNSRWAKGAGSGAPRSSRRPVTGRATTP